MVDIKHEVRDILIKLTDDMMRSVSYEADNNEELYEYMTEGCAAVLVERFMDGEYSPMTYNTLRNELANVLWNIFKPHINNEHNE